MEGLAPLPCTLMGSAFPGLAREQHLRACGLDAYAQPLEKERRHDPEHLHGTSGGVVSSLSKLSGNGPELLFYPFVLILAAWPGGLISSLP